MLDAIAKTAARLCGADKATIRRRQGESDRYAAVAHHGFTPQQEAYSRQNALIAGPGSVAGQVAASRQTVHVPDIHSAPWYTQFDLAKQAGYQSVLSVPLLRKGRLIGVLTLLNTEARAFSPEQIERAETFADQAVIAINNTELFEEVETRTQALAQTVGELEEKSRQLAEASRHKSQFLANMSHELRTPLNSVLGFTEMLADGLYGELPEKVKVTLGRIQSNGRHLLGLINDVLDLSKIEAGQLTLAMEDYSIGQIVKAVVATTEPLARAKGLRLSATVADGLPFGHGDERRISQVLLNLAGNAVKFTDRGSIDITAMTREGHFEILVRDTGPGIAPEHQQRIFEEFQQIDGSSTRQKGGTGLGLAISKRIVELHGGRIDLDSLVGAGSTFRVRLPVKAAQAASAT